MTRRDATRRRPYGSVAVLVVLALVVVVVAANADGYRTPDLRLHDAGIWITRADQTAIGRVNTQIDGQVEVRERLESAAGFDLHQSGDVVLVHRGGGAGAGSLTPVDGRLAKERPEGVVELPPGASVGLGGPPGAVPTLGILDATGQVWVGPVDSFEAQRLTVPPGEEAPAELLPPALVVDDATELAVGVDGTTWVWAPATGTVLGIDGLGVEVGSVSLAPVTEDHDLELTVVGATPVGLDLTEGTVLLPRGRQVDLGDHGDGPRLQQPGVERDAVLVSTVQGLFAVPLVEGRDVETLHEGANAGPAAPVFNRGCAWAAWSGVPTAVRRCDGATEATPWALSGIPANSTLKFRTNRGKVVLNSLEQGESYLLGDGDPAEISWAYTEEQIVDDQPSDEQTTVVEPNQQEDPVPPVAVDDTGPDRFATRPGRPVITDPLRNDSDENGDVLVIESVQQVQPADAQVAVVLGGRAVQVVPPANAPEVTFSYTINDGTGQPTATADVEVAVSTGAGGPPRCSRGEPQQTFVRAGAAVTHNVLADAVDPDGDTVNLVVPLGLAADQGTATADPDGTVVYTPPGTGFSGVTALPYTIRDETGTETACELLVEVFDPEAGNEPPVARPDHAETTVEEEVTVDVLANDSDADGDALRVVSVSTFPNATATVDPGGRVHVRSATAQTVDLRYSVTDGRHEVVGRLRVDVRAPGEGRAPVAVRDDVVLRPGVAATVDVLQNDHDPDGDVLVVGTVRVAAGSRLRVEIIEHRFLRIDVDGGGALDQPESFEYVVSDGALESTGVVLVRPGPTSSQDQPPNAVSDTYSIRAGTIAALDVLTNDTDPEGGRLAVDLLPPPDGTPDPLAGRVFAQGDLLRFVAPDEPGSFEIPYVAIDPKGNRTASSALVHVLAVATANNGPRPPDLTARTVAGREITIPIPVATMDPDGDTVVLLGLGDRAPAHGAIVAVGRDRLTYLPDRFDTDGDGVADGFFGTDVFTYRVRDSLGAEAVATIRVGVAKPADRNSPPVAVDDLRVVPAGTTSRLDLTRNDSDPDGDLLRVDVAAGFGTPPGAVYSVQVGDDGRLAFDPGPMVEGDEATFTYTVTDGILTDTGLVRIRITTEGNLPPAAEDDLWEATPGGETTDPIPVLENDVDPDGEHDDLRVVEVSDPSLAAVTADRRAVTVTVPLDREAVVVYTVEDGAGQRARAVIRVPLADGERRRPVAVFDAATTGEGAAVTVDVLANDVVSAGLTATLFDVTSRRGGTCAVAGDRVTFTPDPGFVGTSGCTYDMGDGPGDDPLTLRALGMVGVTVERSGNTPPTFVQQDLTVVANGETRADLAEAVDDPDEGQQHTFGDIQGQTDTVTASFEGSVLVVRARSNAREGDVVALDVRISDGQSEIRGVVRVTVSEFTGALAVTVPDTDRTFEDVPVELDVLANDQRAENGDPLRIVDVGPADGGTVDFTPEGLVTFTPRAGFFGSTTFRYVVDDGTEQLDRRVEGLVTVDVIGRPDAPPAPAVTRESGAIALTWGVPAANGAPITEYRVEAEGGPIAGPAVRTTGANALRFTGLTNGATYRFRIAAVNEATAALYQGGPLPPEEFSAWSEGIVPNEAPPIPTAPTATYTEDDHDGGSLTVSWTDPGGEGTAVQRYVLQISPPPAGGSGERTIPDPDLVSRSNTIELSVDGLTNGVPYQFRVQAINVLQGDLEGRSEFGPYSNAETPARPPDAPPSPTIDTEGDDFLVVAWQPPVDDGGATIDGYVVEYSRNGTVVGTTSLLPPDTRTHRIDSDNGEAYRFRVLARNKAGDSPFSAPSPEGVSFGKPGPVPGITATEGNGTSQLTITAPVDNDGDAITSWQYRQAVNGAAFGGPESGWQPFGGSGATVPAPNGSTYVFQIRGCNRAGCSEQPGTSSNSVAPYGPPSQPGAVSTSGSVTWSWGASSAGGAGRTITHYEVVIDGSARTVSGTSTSSSHGQACRSIPISVIAVSDAPDPARRRSVARTGSWPAPCPPPVVEVRRGRSAQGNVCDSGTCGPGVFYVDIRWANLPSGSHAVRCYDGNDSDASSPFGNPGSVSGSSGGWVEIECWTDASVYGGVYVTVGGVRSATETW